MKKKQGINFPLSPSLLPIMVAVSFLPCCPLPVGTDHPKSLRVAKARDPRISVSSEVGVTVGGARAETRGTLRRVRERSKRERVLRFQE